MPGGAKMLGGVAVRGGVAAADVAGGATQPQVHPDRACLQAFLAAARAGRHVANDVFVRACFRHQALPGLRNSAGRFCASARNACSVATTCAPSPTAAATRLVEPECTSPM